jgi:amino acid transporter
VAVNEESEGSADGPGRAAVLSTILLVLIYVIVSAAAQSYAGTKFLTDNSADVLSVLGNKVFGDPWNKLLIIAVLTSASASTQTTILPTARTTLSMARFKAIPEAFGRIHPRYLTPTTSTIAMGVVSAIWTILVLALNPAQNVLGDSITALGFGICFYYGLTAFACVVFFRREIFKSARNFFFVGLVPLLGGLMLLGIFIKALTHYSLHKEAGALVNYAKPIAGIEVPIAIGIGSLLLGVVVMLIAWPNYREFFARKPEAAQEGTLEAPVEHAAAHL